MSRNLYLMRGVPGAGKTTWIKTNELEHFTVSIDDLRTLTSQRVWGQTPETHLEKSFPWTADSTAWKMAYEIVETRMQQGLTTVVDATHLFKRGTTKAFNKWLKMAEKYGYRVTTVTVNEDMSLEQLKINNHTRPEYDRVPDDVVESYYERLHSEEFSVPSRANPVSVTSYDRCNELFMWRPMNVSKWEEVIFIGDIHGSWDALKKVLPADNKLNESTLYVFLGDLFDRGIQNYEIAKFFKEHVDDPNVVIIEGNHEERLVKYVSGSGIQGRDFPDTIKQIKDGGFTEEQMVRIFKRIVRRMQPMLWFKHNGKAYVATHAGITNPSIDPRVSRILLEPEETFTRGAGGYNFNFDKQSLVKFNNIHGHRNTFLNPIYNKAGAHANISLEQQVEFGGNLGVFRINLDTSDEDAELYPNEVHSPDLQPRDELSMPQAFRQGLKTHREIIEKDMGNGLFAYNFTRNAFRRGLWDDGTIQARGLIMDRSDHIVARGFKKFFTINDNQDSTIEKVVPRLDMNNTVVQKKYNGFLLIASWADQLDDVLFTTKGGVTTGRYIDIAMGTFTPEERETVYTYLATHKQESMLFEVVNTNIDPHLINDDNGVYLLDVVHNDTEGLSVYSGTKDWAIATGYPDNHVAARMRLESITMISEDGLRDLMASRDENEGWVITNLASGYKVKIKTQSYRARKTLRNWLHSVKGHGSNVEAINTYIDKKSEHIAYFTEYLDLIKLYANKINGEVMYNDYTDDIDMIKTLKV